MTKFTPHSKFGLVRSLFLAALVSCLACGVAGCKKSSRLPNPVESKDGVSYIPINDTAFLIPEKTWLKGYGRNSTDGLVSSITLHATIPDVQPWSQARHEEMYWPAGPGEKLVIHIKGDRADQTKAFPHVPSSVFQSFEFVEEDSDQAAQGLRRFRKLRRVDPAGVPKLRKEFGDKAVDELLAKDGTPYMDTVYYERIEHERVKYFIYCSDSKEPLFQGCHLLFPCSGTLMVDVDFDRDHIRDIVAMADKLHDHLRNFEGAGQAYRATKSKPGSTSSTQ